MDRAEVFIAHFNLASVLVLTNLTRSPTALQVTVGRERASQCVDCLRQLAVWLCCEVPRREIKS